MITNYKKVRKKYEKSLESCQNVVSLHSQTITNTSIMTRVALRTLAEKSTLKFGKFSDLTVRQVIQLHGIKGIKYLRWVYYSASNISFNEDLLKEIGIHEEIKITKPGKVSEDEIANYLRKVEKVEISEPERRISIKTRNVLIKAKRMKQVTFFKSSFKKSRNQNRNHGRKF